MNTLRDIISLFHLSKCKRKILKLDKLDKEISSLVKEFEILTNQNVALADMLYVIDADVQMSLSEEEFTGRGGKRRSLLQFLK